MVQHFSPTASNAEYWSYTAGAMGEFLTDALEKRCFAWELLPINVYNEALAFFTSAIAVANGETAGNKVGNMSNYKTASDALRANRVPSQFHRAEVDTTLKEYREVLETIRGRQELISDDELTAVRGLRDFFVQLAADGENMAYSEALQFDPVRNQLIGKR